MTRRLYRTPIPESAYRDTGETSRTQLSKLAALSGSSPVESTGQEASDLTLNVQYRGEYAGRLALELSELLHSDTGAAIPYAPVEGTAEDDGYYAAESVSPSRIRPQTDRVVNVDASLSRKGTRASHLQAVATSKSSRANDFGSGQTTHVAAPASASLVEWWDGDAATEEPSPVETRSAEHGDIEIYDVDAASYSDPTLLYRPVGYDEIGDVDVGVWDTYGTGSITDANGVTQWQRVFAPDHNARGAFVLENGLLRLTVDDGAETLTAEQWDSGTSSWAPTTLGTSGWAPLDVDVRTIQPARLEARIRFSDGSSTYTLDCILTRGAEEMLFVRTPNAQSATPQGLIDLLDPIAATTIYDAGASQKLVTREEVSE